MPKHSATLVKAIRAKVEAGGLTEYLAKCERIKQAKAVLPGIIVAARTAYDRIADVYSVASVEARTIEEIHGLVASPLYTAQHAANRLFRHEDAPSRASWVHFPAVQEIEYMAEGGALDASEALAMVQDRIGRLEAITW